MQTIRAREAKFERVYRWAYIVYLAVSAGLFTYHMTRADMYQGAQSLLSVALAALPPLFYRVTGLKRTYQLDVIVLVFMFLAHTLGVAAVFYHVVPYYDKVMHALSGTLTMMLALPFFYLLKRPHVVEKRDGALAVAFCLCAALAVAGLWEVVEYFINRITGIDVQAVALSGVTDTMRDMIVCLAGALAVVPAMAKFFRSGKTGFTMNALTGFVELNFYPENGKGEVGEDEVALRN